MAKYTRVSQIDPENHPLFNRLWTTEGFERLTSESVEKFLDTPGLKIALFGDDPNNQKETLDILVIGAELKKAIEAALAPENGAWMSDVKEGSALAARWGMRKLPAVALFRGSVYLGACQGLKDWDEYLRELAEIAARTEAPKRTISILPAGGQADHHCG